MHIKKSFYIITSFFLLNSFLIAQSVNLKKEFSNTNKLYKEKKYDEALLSNNKAINLSIKEFGDNHLTTATLLENKGRLLLKINKYAEAQTNFEKVVNIRNKLIKKNNPDTAEALDYLALSLRKQNKLEQAITIHNKVLTMMGTVIANNPGQISELTRRSALYRARAYQTKGEQLIREDNIKEALGNFKIAVKIFERTLGKNKNELDLLIKKLNSIESL